MSDSDSLEKERAQVRKMMQDIDQMEDVLAEAKRLGIEILSGPVSVELAIKVEDADTPQEAVEMVQRQIMRHGFEYLVFRVHDIEAGEDYFVRGDKLLSREAMVAEATDQTDGQTDGHAE